MDDNVMHIFGFVIKPIHVSVFYNSIFLLMGAGSIYAWFKTRWQSRSPRRCRWRKGANGPISTPLSCRSKRRCRRAGKGKRLVIENGAEAEVNAGLVEMIKEAFAIRNQLLSGSHDSIEAMSGRLAMNKGRLPERRRPEMMVMAALRRLDALQLVR
jgi:hypothetical protein